MSAMNKLLRAILLIAQGFELHTPNCKLVKLDFILKLKKPPDTRWRAPVINTATEVCRNMQSSECD